MFRILSQARPRDTITWSPAPDGPSLSYEKLAGDALALARALYGLGVQGGEVILDCRSRYWFAVGLLGAWQAESCVVLVPPERANRPPASLVLTDLRAKVEAPRSLLVSDVVAIGGRGDLGELRPIEETERLVTVYTSGTSGESRAWVKTARQLLGEAELLVQHFDICAHDRILCTAPPEHLYGLLFGVIAPLRAGASVCDSPPHFGASLVAVAERFAPTLLVSVPAHLKALSEELWLVNSLRQVISSSAPLSSQTARRVEQRLRAPVIDVLGSTETGGIAVRRTGLVDTWQTLPRVKVEADAEDRLLVSSPFVEDPTRPYLAADRVEIVAPGKFRHLGRTDGVVKVGGRRVNLLELEERVRALPGVSDARVLAVETVRWRDTELWLAVETSSWSLPAIKSELARLLEPMSMPRRIKVLASLPREATGKVARGVLERLFLSDIEAQFSSS